MFKTGISITIYAVNKLTRVVEPTVELYIDRRQLGYSSSWDVDLRDLIVRSVSKFSVL